MSSPPQIDPIDASEISRQDLEEAARRTEGMSGRELSKMMAGMQAAVYGSRQPKLSKELFYEVLDQKVHEHHNREAFLAGTYEASGPKVVSAESV